jgi:hypothetical protein
MERALQAPWVRDSRAAHAVPSLFDSVPGYGAAWLARFTGGEEVVGSNPATPTMFDV